MAIIKQGILGGLSGSVGGVVGSSWKGKNVIKSKPVSVANPQTAGQVEQRSRMSAVVLFAQAILSIWIKPLFDRFAQGQSGFNAFVSRNIANFVNGTIVAYEELVMSIGNMALTSIDTVAADLSVGTVVLTWTPDTEGFHLASDFAYIIAFNVEKESVSSSNVAIRSAGTGSCTLPAGSEVGDTIWAFLVFKRVNGLYVGLSSGDSVLVVA
jgi:hypothetical protein